MADFMPELLIILKVGMWYKLCTWFKNAAKEGNFIFIKLLYYSYNTCISLQNIMSPYLAFF